MCSEKEVSRPAWRPTQEQKERADKACADALAQGIDETDAVAYVATSARGLIGDLGDLRSLITDPSYADELGAARMPDLGLDPDGFDEDNVWEAFDQLPLAVEATTTFEVVLGVGGPDRRLCFECSTEDQDPASPGMWAAPSFEIRRVFYVYSWEGSAEVDLTGEDRETAEAFGRRVVAELSE